MATVKLFGNLRSQSDSSVLEVQGNTVREVLELLGTTQPHLPKAIMAGDGLQPYVQVMVNGRNIELADGLETAVTETDQIAVFPPIAGG